MNSVADGRKAFEEAGIPIGLWGLLYMFVGRLMDYAGHWLTTIGNALLRRLMRLHRVLWRTRYKSARKLLHRRRDDDIFIVSYPKAGTTVMQMMLHQIMTDGRLDFEHIDAVVPWFDQRLVTMPAMINSLASPRLFKTHLPFRDLPRGARYIYLLRNPKDTCVSYYYHLMNGERFPMSQFVQGFIEGDVPWGSWFHHLESCAAFEDAARVLVVGYDQIAADLPEVVDRVSAFCGRPLSPDKRGSVLQRCGLASMKAHQSKFDPRFMVRPEPVGQLVFDPRFMQRPQRTDQRDFIRKGVSGDWANELSPALADHIDRQLARTIRQLGGRLAVGRAELVSPRPAPVRGTLSFLLGSEPDHRLVMHFQDSLAPRGMRCAIRDQPVNIGDFLRLRLWIAASEEVIIDAAEVLSVVAKDGVPMAALEFHSIAPDHRQRLEAFCASATGPLLEYTANGA